MLPGSCMLVILVRTTLSTTRPRKGLREHFMWLFWLHNNRNINLDLRQVSVILFSLWPHKIITLNIVVGLDEYLLNNDQSTQHNNVQLIEMINIYVSSNDVTSFGQIPVGEVWM